MADPAKEDVLAGLESDYNEARHLGGNPDSDPIKDLEKNLSTADPDPDPEPDPDPDPDPDPAPDPAPDPDPDEDPPGFMPYEDWVAAGKDPDDYRGKNAYNKQFDNIQENKELKTMLRENAEMLKEVTDTIGEQREQAYEQGRTALEEKLEQQKNDLDVEGALATKDALDNLPGKKNEDEPAERQVNPVIADFLTKNSITNRNSSSYDPEFYDAMARYHAHGVNELSQSGGGDLSDPQIEAIAKTAFNKAKTLFPDKFESSKNSRPGVKPSRNRKTSGSTKTTGDMGAQLKKIGLKTRNNIDGKNTNAAFETYELLKKKNPAQADKYAQNIIKIAEADNG